MSDVLGCCQVLSLVFVCLALSAFLPRPERPIVNPEVSTSCVVAASTAAAFDNLQLAFGQLKDLILSSEVSLRVIRSGHGFKRELIE